MLHTRIKSTIAHSDTSSRKIITDIINNVNLSKIRLTTLEDNMVKFNNTNNTNNLNQSHIKFTDNILSDDTINVLNDQYIKCFTKIDAIYDHIKLNYSKIRLDNTYYNTIEDFIGQYVDEQLPITVSSILNINNMTNTSLKIIYFEDAKFSNKFQDQYTFIENYKEYQKQNQSNNLSQPLIVYHMASYLSTYDKHVNITIGLILPDILNPNKKILITIPLDITALSSNVINKLEDFSDKYTQFLNTIMTNFNNFSNNSNGNLSDFETIYQYGPDSSFDKLKVVSSTQYPYWNNCLINTCYINGSTVNMPRMIRNINIELNKKYGKLITGQHIMIENNVDGIYYINTVEMMIKDDLLCYKLLSTINMNDVTENAVTINGDSEIYGSLNVLKHNGEPVISMDNTDKITCFHNKIGINQYPHEVSGLLDIDNLTQQKIVDILTDFTPYLLNSYDIIQVINTLDSDIISAEDIKPLFDNGNKLFDYKEQSIVFEIELQASPNNTNNQFVNYNYFGQEQIVNIHNTVNDPFDINNVNQPFLNTLHRIVKESSNLTSEFINAADPNNILSFVELVEDKNNRYYICSIRAIMRNITPEYKKIINVMTFLDITPIMIEPSYQNIFSNIVEYFGKINGVMNLAGLLVKDPVIYNQLKNGDSVNSFTAAIKDNLYFYKRNNLLPESYFFCINMNTNDYLFHELNTNWNLQNINNLWNANEHVADVINIMYKLFKESYSNRTDGIFPIWYVWNAYRKLSFVNIITVNGVRYMLGSGVLFKSVIDLSILIKGDNVINGNLIVGDTDNNVIFKVDNVSKTITNTYKVGVGINNPESILHVKDTTLQDVIDEMNVGIQQHNIKNLLLEKLRDNKNIESDFDTIIENNVGIQNVDQYFVVFKLNLDTLLADDMIVSYHWLFKHWKTQKLKDIDDPNNNYALNIIKTTYQQMLNEDCMFDMKEIVKVVFFVYGYKRLRFTCFVNNNDMYLLCVGTNIQQFNLQFKTNNNIQRLMDVRNTYVEMLYDMVRRLKNPSPIINIQEGLNNLNTLMSMNINKINRVFLIDIDKSNIQNSLIADFDFNQLIAYTKITLTDLDNNDRTKYTNFIISLTKNTSIIKKEFACAVTYDDLYKDYVSILYCTKTDNNITTFIGVEFCVTDIIIPSLKVEGDAKIIGDLLISNQTTSENFMSVDPIQKFVGINTDERFINYNDLKYTTLSGRQQHQVYIKNDKYPNMVCERIQENKDDTSNPESINPRYFSTYSASTMKRKSNLYTFDEINTYSKQLDSMVDSSDKITHMRYGADIAFEVCDKTNRSVELGDVQMTIDRIDEYDHLRGGFSVQVLDRPTEATSNFETVRRNIMYVNNDGTLFINKIMLGGKELACKEDGTLSWGGKKVVLK